MTATWPEAFETAFELYEVQELVGQGGSGKVFKVTNADQKPFGIKCLDPDRVTRDKLKRFQNELSFCREHRHRNVVAVLAYGRATVKGRSCPFYVMPYYPATLRHLMKQGISHNKVLPYFSQILDGVEAAHLLDIWHRDLKPENILHSPESDTLVVADFGIAHFAEEYLLTLVETGPSDRLANFQYAAPEQRVRDQVVDKRCDIFALGLILNEMFTGNVIQGTRFMTISTQAPGYAYLDELVDLMVCQVPHERPSSIDEIKQSLIARENEFVSRQKLDRLRQRVVPRYALNDPLIDEPVTLDDVDYREGRLVFILSQPVNSVWINHFKTPGSLSSIVGHELRRFRFHGNEAVIALTSEASAQRLVGWFKEGMQNANSTYKRQRMEKQKRKEEKDRQRLERETQEEEKRQRILRSIRV